MVDFQQIFRDATAPFNGQPIAGKAKRDIE